MDIVVGVFNIVRQLFCLAQGANCNSKVGLLLPKGFGKTHLSQSLQSKNKDTILLDIESLVSMSLTDEQRTTLNNLQRSQEYQNIKLFMLPIMKAFLTDIRTKFKKSGMIIFTSSPEALSHMEVRTKLVYVPSQSFFDDVLSKIPDEQKKKVMTNSRNEIISQYGSKARIFSSFQDLERQISEEMDLSPKI